MDSPIWLLSNYPPPSVVMDPIETMEQIHPCIDTSAQNIHTHGATDAAIALIIVGFPFPSAPIEVIDIGHNCRVSWQFILYIVAIWICLLVYFSCVFSNVLNFTAFWYIYNWLLPAESFTERPAVVHWYCDWRWFSWTVLVRRPRSARVGLLNHFAQFYALLDSLEIVTGHWEIQFSETSGVGNIQLKYCCKDSECS